jgi:glycerol-3-phosphate acyltransferase PlsY
MIDLLWVAAAFFVGTLPFSLWVGQLLLGQDIRRYGDANPGATNVLRAGGKGAALLALLLDFLKGALPVGVAHLAAEITGWPLIAVAVAPVAGHAFSPWLGFRGGKAVATTGGIWCGLTIWEGPTVGGLLLGLAYFLLAVDGWAVLTAFGALLLYLLLTPASWNLLAARPEPWIILAVWVGTTGIVAWKHRQELTKPFAWRARRAVPANR